MNNQFDHIRRGLSKVQNILDENHNDLIESIINAAYTDMNPEINKSVQDKAKILQQQIEDKNRIIKAMADALNSRPQREDWSEVVNYFKYCNENGLIADPNVVEKMTEKIVNRVNRHVTDDSSNHTMSTFVVGVMTKEPATVTFANSSNDRMRAEEAYGKSCINELAEKLQQNIELVEISDRLQIVLRDLVGAVQSYSTPMLTTLEKLVVVDNSGAVKMDFDSNKDLSHLKAIIASNETDSNAVGEEGRITENSEKGGLSVFSTSRKPSKDSTSIQKSKKSLSFALSENDRMTEERSMKSQGSSKHTDDRSGKLSKGSGISLKSHQSNISLLSTRSSNRKASDAISRASNRSLTKTIAVQTTDDELRRSSILSAKLSQIIDDASRRGSEAIPSRTTSKKGSLEDQPTEKYEVDELRRSSILSAKLSQIIDDASRRGSEAISSKATSKKSSLQVQPSEKESRRSSTLSTKTNRSMASLKSNKIDESNELRRESEIPRQNLLVVSNKSPVSSSTSYKSIGSQPSVDSPRRISTGEEESRSPSVLVGSTDYIWVPLSSVSKNPSETIIKQTSDKGTSPMSFTQSNISRRSGSEIASPSKYLDDISRSSLATRSSTALSPKEIHSNDKNSSLSPPQDSSDSDNEMKRSWSLRDSVELARSRMSSKFDGPLLRNELRKLLQAMEKNNQEINTLKEELINLESKINKSQRVNEPKPIKLYTSSSNSQQPIGQVVGDLDILRKYSITVHRETQPGVQNEHIPERIDRLIFAIRRKISNSCELI